MWCEQCVHKYGEYFTYPLQHLKELKKHKKQKMKEIVRAMESFNANLQGGKRLVKALERDVVSLSVCSPHASLLQALHRLTQVTAANNKCESQREWIRFE